MREILFRGKSKATDEWYYGNLDVNVKGVCIITPDDTPIGKYGQVIPETVGQYTGLTDKNGKKIFEGDIIKEYDNERVYRIEYCDYYNYPAFDVEPELSYCDCNGLSYLVNAEIVEVIGNIHDNPELLKGGTE